MKAPKKFAIWSFSSSKSSSSISGSSRTKKRRKRYTKYTEEKEAEDENWQKNADFLPFLALFQGKELCFVLCGKQFLIRPLPFGLNSCMTQQNKGVSKNFYKERSTWYLLSYFTLITQNRSNEKRSLNFLLLLTPPSPSLSPSLSPPPSLALPPSLAVSLPPLALSLSPPSLTLPSLSRCLSPPFSLSLSPSLALPLFHSLSAPPSLSLPKLMHTRAVRISVFSWSHHT